MSLEASHIPIGTMLLLEDELAPHYIADIRSAVDKAPSPSILDRSELFKDCSMPRISFRSC